MYLPPDHANLLGLRRTTPPTVLERGLEATSAKNLQKPLSTPLKSALT
jgi:hypothetical protein